MCVGHALGRTTRRFWCLYVTHVIIIVAFIRVRMLVSWRELIPHCVFPTRPTTATGSSTSSTCCRNELRIAQVLVGRCRLDARPAAAAAALCTICICGGSSTLVKTNLPQQLPPSKLFVIHKLKVAAGTTAAGADTSVPVINYVGIGVAAAAVGLLLLVLLLLIIIVIMLENVERIREGGQRRAGPWIGALLLLMMMIRPGHNTMFVRVMGAYLAASDQPESDIFMIISAVYETS